MPPTATLIENSGPQRPRLVRTAGVFSGTRHYMIENAATLGDTYNAIGLPAAGSPWDQDHPQCKARVYDPVLAPGPSGVYFMRVDYGQDTLTEYTADPELVITTTLEQNASSETVDFDPEGLKSQTNDGRGVPKMVSSLSLTVLKFFEDLPNIEPFLELSDEPKVNSDQVTLQNFMNSGQALVVPEEQLLYTHFTLGYEQGLFTVRHHLQRRRFWFNQRPMLDASGKQRINPGTQKGMFEVVEVYEYAPMMGVIG